MAVWWPRLRGHLPALGAAAALATLTAGAPGVVVWGLRDVAVAVGAGSPAQAGRAVGLVVGVAVLSVGARVLRTALTKGVAWRVATSLRTELHRRWLALGIAGAPVGDRVAALTDEVDQVQYGISGAVTLFRDPLTLCGLGMAAAWAAPGLAPWLLLAFAPVALVGWVSAGWVAAAARRMREARAHLAATATEQLTGWEVIDLFGAHRREGDRFEADADADRAARVHLDVVRGLPSALTEVLALAAVGALLVLAAAAVAAGRQDPAGLVALAAALGLAVRPLSRLSEGVALLRRADTALARVEAALAGPPLSLAASVERSPVAMGVELRDAEVVDGATVVLGPVSLSIPAGALVVLVGATGSGKTTLLRLVAGTRAPTRGEALVGGRSLAGLPADQRAARVVAVPQDGFLFARSVAENLRLGAPGATDEHLLEALAQAHAGFVTDHGDGLGRVLGPAGAPLSGGERQRLALARAVVAGAPVVLLDEPTNQVDPATEAALVAALGQLRGTCTLVVASHDRQVAMAADLVVVLQEGQVVAAGAPAELAARPGAFRDVMAVA